MSDITDPIDGLIRYVNEIKPFHSKIIEVLTEYVYEESVNVTIAEDSLLDVGINIGAVQVDDGTSTSSSTYGGGYGDGPFDSAQYFPVIAVNSTLSGAFDASEGSAKLGWNSATNTVVLPGDQTAIYRQDRYINVSLWLHTQNNSNTEPVAAFTSTPQILSSTYVTTGQTNGISDTPRTVLVLSDLFSTSSYPKAPSQEYAGRVTLQPVDVLSVVAGMGDTNTGRIRYSNINMGGSTSEPPYGIPGQPQIPRDTPPFTPTVYSDPTLGDGNITTLDNYITLSGDQTTSYPYGASLLMLLQSGATVNYTVALSYYNDTAMETTVELLQELDPSADYTNAQAIEAFSGFANQYVLPTATTTNIPEGLTQTAIAESIVFSWNDGIDEVENFVQFIVVKTTGAQIETSFDGRTLSDHFSNGQNIRIWGPDNNEELATISSISGNIITATAPINTSITASIDVQTHKLIDAGFVELA